MINMILMNCQKCLAFIFSYIYLLKYLLRDLLQF